MKIGDRIRIRREELEMSQDELARILGYKSRSSINKIEKDASGLPQTKISDIAKALLTTPAYIMGWDANASEIDALHSQMLKDEDFTDLYVHYKTLSAKERKIVADLIHNLADKD